MFVESNNKENPLKYPPSPLILGIPIFLIMYSILHKLFIAQKRKWILNRGFMFQIFHTCKFFLVSISMRLKTSSINFCNSKGVASEKSSIRQLVFNSLKFHTICAIRLLLINYYIKTGHVFIQVALSKHKKPGRRWVK